MRVVLTNCPQVMSQTSSLMISQLDNYFLDSYYQIMPLKRRSKNRIKRFFSFDYTPRISIIHKYISKPVSPVKGTEYLFAFSFQSYVDSLDLYNNLSVIICINILIHIDLLSPVHFSTFCPSTFCPSTFCPSTFFSVDLLSIDLLTGIRFRHMLQWSAEGEQGEAICLCKSKHTSHAGQSINGLVKTWRPHQENLPASSSN